MRAPSAQRGFLLIVAVILIVVAAAIAVAIATLTAGGGQSGALQLTATQALYAAESGLERALYGYDQSANCTATYSSSLPIGSVSNAANYSASGTAYVPSPTTLSTGISATATVIPVASTTGFAPYGRTQVDSEYIDYGGTSNSASVCGTAPCFTSALRGRAGSTASTHSSGAPVAQNVCSISSVGQVPATGAQRTMVAVVQSIQVVGTPVAETGSGTGISWSLTTPAGIRNGLVLVGISFRSDNNQSVSSVTYGSQTLQLVPGTDVQRRAGGKTVHLDVYFLTNPPAGTANLAVSFNAPTSVVAGAIVFSGVNQTPPIEKTGTNSGVGKFISSTVATLSDNAWVFDVVALGPTGSLTMSSAPNRVKAWNTGTGLRPFDVDGAAAYQGPISPPASVTSSWTATTSEPWVAASAALKPALGGVVYWREQFR